MAMAAYSGNIHIFQDDQNFEIFEERFEQYCAANKVTEESIKIALLISHLSIEVYSTLRDLCFPQKPKVKKYSDLKTLLSQHYSPQVNAYRERIQFYGASQQDDVTRQQPNGTRE